MLLNFAQCLGSVVPLAIYIFLFPVMSAFDIVNDVHEDVEL